MLKHIVFSQDAGGLAAATAFRDKWDALYGYPLGPQITRQHFADVLINVPGLADPNAANARFAVDASRAFVLYPGDPNSQTGRTFITDMLTEHPLPPGAIAIPIDTSDSEWAPEWNPGGVGL
jgi:hypothetical protein